MAEYKLNIELTGAQSVNSALGKAVSDLDKISASGAKTNVVFEHLKNNLGVSGGSLAFQLRNAHLFKKAIEEINPKLDAMNDLTRRGSQAAIDLAAEIAMADSKINDALSKEVQGPDLSGKLRKKFQSDLNKTKADTNSFIKDLKFLIMPILNPGSVWATLFSSRQTFSGLNTEKGQEILGKFGLSGIEGAAIGTGVLVGAATAAGAALMAFTASVKFATQEIKKAFEFAHQLYGKSLSSGLSLSFMANRQMTANVLGVPENEVFRFKQSTYVMQRLSGAVAEIAKAAPDLAYTSAQFKILQYDILASASTMADKLAPALNAFAIGLDKIVKILSSDLSMKAFSTIADSFFKILFGTDTDIAKLFAKFLESAGGNGSFGTPKSFMKQMPASSWEHMGLVIGQFGGSNAIKQTAQNTKETAQAVKEIAKHLTFTRGGSPMLSPYQAMP
jgi:hypothetical protein